MSFSPLERRTPERREMLPDRDADGKPLYFACKRYGHVSKYCHQRSEVPRESTRRAAGVSQGETNNNKQEPQQGTINK